MQNPTSKTAHAKFQPTRRLISKTTPRTAFGYFEEPDNPNVNHPNPAASSSSGQHGDPSLDWRRGEG